MQSVMLGVERCVLLPALIQGLARCLPEPPFKLVDPVSCAHFKSCLKDVTASGIPLFDFVLQASTVAFWIGINIVLARIRFVIERLDLRRLWCGIKI